MPENSPIRTRLLKPADAALFREIRLEALKLSPEAFGSSFEQEGPQPLAYFEEVLKNSDVFGAFRGPELLGMAGYRPQAGAKKAHKGFLWGMYVRSSARGAGVGRHLVTAVLDHARERVELIQLSVVSENVAARRLYRALGFVDYGHEVRSLKQGGRYYDEVLMAAALDTASNQITEETMALTLTSNSFKEGETLKMDHILSADYGFGCGGGNKSPHLAWSGVPDGTKSFAVTCFDPDAPTGSGFWHWVLVNIPAGTTELKLDAGNPKAGLLPKGALLTRTDFGAPGYGGPCPPEGHGPHRYVFTLFAVGQETLPVNADTSAAIIGFQLHFNTIAKATLTGMFQR